MFDKYVAIKAGENTGLPQKNFFSAAVATGSAPGATSGPSPVFIIKPSGRFG
jgi:hypothetical protein